ncbi:MAG: glycine--tRNA ligase subunit beta [Polyangia bacterium]|jgi:glycyl-tRNA synthetase beta chain|nr:glycine--tRNA ligase subunit beta [Polyangia bacterium]
MSEPRDLLRDFLLEIGCEEIPAAELDAALGALPALAEELLGEARLGHGAIKVWGAPRRLAIFVGGLPERQPDLEELLTGPPESVAYKDGAPTQAAVKFAEKAGVGLEALALVDTPKGRYVTGRRRVAGQATIEVLPGICRKLIEGLSFRKVMRWADRPERFVRALRWLVALFGEEVLPVELAGVRAGRESRGHRFHSPGPVAISSPAGYEAALEGARVVPDPEKRRRLISEQIQALAAKEGAELIRDEALLGEVANLVELPVAVAGEFDPRALEVPREVVLSAMRGHQRYFALEKGGALTNRFITVLGTEVRDLGVAVRGNQRVLAARLADARFFWEEDLKAGLARRAEGLAKVVFQQKLGTVAQKVSRLERLAASLAPAFGADPALAREAARLCKADLCTHMVGEFPDLQGVMGRYYALAQGAAPVVADAILEHYQPRGAGDALPRSPEGAALAVADRLDTLVGCLAAGLKPKGGGDPFGLRRAALGVLRILLERRIGGSLLARAEAASELHDLVRPDPGEAVGFVLERLRGLLGETAPGEIVQAVMSAGGDDPLDLADRVKAVEAYSRGPDYAALAVTFRRMNILRQADVEVGEPEAARLVERAERALHEAYLGAAGAVAGHVEARRYDLALEVLSGLRPPVDALFDEVKVMDDDAAVRANRLALLAAVDRLFRRVADFKLIAS